MLQFLGFELDRDRVELRGPDGGVIKIRLRSLEMLKFFAANPGRVLSKQELMEAVWPDVHVAEDSVFQSIRELRSALGDDQRQIIKLISGRGYLFVAEVSDTRGTDAPVEASSAMESETLSEPAPGRHGFGMPRRAVLVAMAGLGASAWATAAWLPRFQRNSPVTVAVMPMAAGDDPQATRMAAGIVRDLTDGLMKIEMIRVVVPSGAAQGADYVVSSELEKTETAWNLRARMIEPATGAGKWTTSLFVERTAANMQLQQTRLTAGMGHALALRVNALLNVGERLADGLPTGSARAAIEQATASINQTSPERLRTAQAMLEQGLADDADNVDLQVALAAFKLRGIQMDWFPAEEREATKNDIGMMMERALRARPNYIPVLETYCRFLSATNRFAESLVACARTLTHNPWGGSTLYLIGLAQIHLGRFDDAVATFVQADRFDTPQVARWTWAVGAGWSYLFMGRAEEALPWLQRSIAITPASGRTHMLLAAAYQQLGRTAEARAAMAKALELRPGSTASNAPHPTKNASPVFLEAAERVMNLMVAAGLPEK
ncbi:transcriptional regulator CadC [Bosea sp. Root381]|nr:transcriptional regulator CadC [Bosea sp. Root381]